VDIIKGLDNKKSTGIDEVSEYIIKKCYPMMISVLTYRYNKFVTLNWNFSGPIKNHKRETLV
jgi:hypothetical protein